MSTFQAEPFLQRLASISAGMLIKRRRLAWLGSASVGITSDRLGRRKAIAFGCAWGVLGAALMAGAAHVAMRKYIGYTTLFESPVLTFGGRSHRRSPTDRVCRWDHHGRGACFWS